MSDIFPQEPPAIIGEQIAGRAATVRKDLENLNALVLDSTFDIAELLAEVKQNSYYGEWGYSTLDEYVEVVLGMKKRKSQYLIRIFTIAKQLGIPRAAYEDVQITKLREIFTLNPTDKEGKDLNSPVTGEPIADHIKTLVHKAHDLKLTEVVAEVARIKGEVGENEMVYIPALKVTKTCRDNVILPARELARQKLGSMAKDEQGDSQEYSDSAVEECIHADFLSDPNNAEQSEDFEYANDTLEIEPEFVIEPYSDASEPLPEGLKI